MGSASSLLSEPEPKFEVTNTSVRALPNILFDADSIPFKTLKLTNNNILSIQHEVQQLTSLEVVDLSHNKIARVPFQLLELPRLRCLSLAGNCLQKIYDVNKATKLQYLDISENHFESMLDVHGLFELNKLKNLQMRSNRLTEIPDIISKLHSLQYLDCSLNEIRIINKLPAALHTFKLRAGRNSRLTIVSNIGNTCRRMKHLDLSNNHIDSKDEAMDNEIGVLSTVSQMTKLTYLNVEGNDINTIPSTFSNLTNLKTCIMKNNNINAHSGVPLTSLPRVEHLDIDNNEFHSIFTISIKSMKYISARANCIVSLPEKMAPEMLEELYLDDNELNDISNVKFNSMAKLRILSLRNNHLQTIPDSLGRVFNLETLDLEGNQINDIPENLSWTRLKKINLSKNKLKQFPTQLEKAPQLENLNLSNNTLGDTTTRTLFSTLQKLKCLNIKNTDSKHIPDGCCHSENLEELILSDNNFEEIPHDIQQMKNLQELHIDNNNIEVVPKHVFQHTSLKSIHANDNKIHTVSHKISANNKGRRLTLLDMSNNILKSLPSSLQNVTTLKTFDVSYNQMYFIPSALVELTATTDSDNKQREILIKGNLARNIPSSVNKNVPLTNLKSVGDESDINQLKRACMYFIGSRSSGKSLLMRKLLLASGSKSGVPETNSLKNNAAFLNSNIWPVHDDIDIKVTDCSGPVELQAIAQLFFVTNAVYIITVNLKQYDPSGDSFSQHIKYWIKYVFSVIGSDFMVLVVGTHCDQITDLHRHECCRAIKDNLDEFLKKFKEVIGPSGLLFSSPCDVVTVGSSQDPEISTQWIQRLQKQIIVMLKNKTNKLLPITVAGLYNNGVPCTEQMLKLESILVEKQEEEEGFQKIRLTTSEFEGLCKDVGMKQSGVDDAKVYLKLIGVVQYFPKVLKFHAYIFHNMDYLKSILQTFAGKTREELLNRRIFPPGYEDTYQVVLNIFNEKAVLSEEVLSMCILKYLEVDDNIIKLVLDLLLGLYIAYEVPVSGNEDAFLHRLEDKDDAPMVVLLPAFLQNSIPEQNIKPVFLAKFEFPWGFPMRLFHIYLCAVHEHVKKHSKEKFLAMINGVLTLVKINKARTAKSLNIYTAMCDDLENTFDKLEQHIIKHIVQLIKQQWPYLQYNILFSAVCTEESGCQDAGNIKYHEKWKAFPKKYADVERLMDECPRRRHEVPVEIIKGQKLSRAVDLVTERFDSQKWKLLAQFLGIQTEAIDRERISVKDKLRTMVQAWSEKHQAPALIPMMKDKLVQALRVVGDAQLANDIEHISIQNWTL